QTPGRRQPFNTDRDWRYRRQKGVLHVQHHLSRRRSRPFPGHEPGGRPPPPASNPTKKNTTIMQKKPAVAVSYKQKKTQHNQNKKN
ncbi:hypothetical protein ACVGXE_00200, partial [Escherichia coli]